MTLRPRSLALILALVVLALGRPSAADKKQCVSAYEEGQRARIGRDLVRAKAELARCALEECPDIVRTDCSEWLRELEREIPTLIVSARFADGTDVSEARVSIDGKQIGERLDGKPVAVNPGEHTVRVEASGVVSEQRVVANQGEQHRALRFVLERPEPKRTAPRPKPVEESSGPGPLPWVLTAVSVASFAGFGYLALDGRSELADLRESCAPSCREEQLDAVKQKLLFADILLGVGIATGGAAAYLFISGAPATEAEGSSASLFVRGRF